MAGTALKIVKFFGEAPKLSPELLPETVAQYAFNLDLSSGDLEPYRRSEQVATLDKTGTIKTIYPLYTPVTGEIKWLHWTTDVDVVSTQVEGDTSQRIYYTGDGAPKVTNYTLATSGTQFPSAYYNLGLPAPSAVLTATPTAFTQKTTATRSRDSGNIATIETSAVHLLTSGDIATTTSLGGTGYNLSNVPVTVIDATHFSYFSFGSAEAVTADIAGLVDLAGLTIPRQYVYTYLTQWDEESVPSEPSPVVFVKEGQTVEVTGLPVTWTHGTGYNTTDMKLRIYRTVVGVSGTEYFRVGEVTLGTASFTDDVDVTTLDTLLPSEDYDAPHPDMQGILAIHNSMLVGFFGNTLCFSEPGKPHAWPIIYRRQVDSTIVGLGAFGTTLLILTENTPWKADGNNPSAISLARTDYILPCLAKRSIVNIGYGVVWASSGGLAVYSTTIGTDYLTKNVHSWKTWPSAVTPALLEGHYYRGRYFGCDGTNTFVFERNDQVGGHLIESDIKFSAAHYKSNTDALYYCDGADVFLWNSPNTYSSVLDWKSKVFTTKKYINFGAARVIADYTGTPEDEAGVSAQNQSIGTANAARLDQGDPMGELGTVEGNQYYVAGSPLQDYVETLYSAVFQLYVNKNLIFSKTCTDINPFRLPTGYRADTFEIRVATTARIRAIHMAETMTGLKGV